LSGLKELNNSQALSIIFLGALFLLWSPYIFGNDDLKECTFSNTPLIGGFFDCRKISEREVNSLKRYWSSEDDAELCHYFYFPLSDPTASKELLLENYLVMQNEIQLRGIDCIKDHRNIFWYRGSRTMSMLEKLIIKYDLELNDD
jgi:hypothetical protein